LSGGSERSRVNAPQLDGHACGSEVQLGRPEADIAQRAVSRFG
jgi:hypothetical protein